MAFPLINGLIFPRFGGSSSCKRFVRHDRDAWPISSFWRALEETQANMAVARVHNRRGCRHAGFGKQPTRCQIQSWQGALPPAAVRAVSLGSKQNGWWPRQARSALVAIVTIRRCQYRAAKRAKMYQMNLIDRRRNTSISSLQNYLKPKTSGCKPVPILETGA
jgi:hypothetical protein